MRELMRYRTIATRIYADEKFRSLSKPAPNGQSLFIYLLTGPHTTNLPGLFCTGKAALAEALEWNAEGFDKAFREVFREGLIKVDLKARLWWLPNATKYNPPQSPNVVKSWRKAFDELPECQLKNEAFNKFKAFLEAFSEDFRKPFRKPLDESKNRSTGPFAKQEQEQEQEQYKETTFVRSDEKAIASGPNPPEEIFTELPLKGKKTTHAVTRAYVAEMKPLYPRVDIEAETLRAKGWLLNNPEQQKTQRGIKRFLGGWYDREQNRGARTNGADQRNGGPSGNVNPTGVLRFDPDKVPKG
jgi:hypothetical protein